MKLQKEFVLLISLVILLIGVAGYFGLKLTKDRETRRLEEEFLPLGTPTPVFGDRFDQSKFNTSEYVNPVGRETVTDLVQIRGIVSSWEADKLNVTVTGDILTIDLPSQVMVRCMPEFTNDSQGRQVKTSEVYLDFTQATVKGNMVESVLIPSEISVGEDVTVQVKLITEDELQAEFIVGYGCSL